MLKNAFANVERVPLFSLLTLFTSDKILVISASKIWWTVLL